MMIPRAEFNYRALVVVLPAGAVVGVMLYLAGARWVLLLLAAVTVLLCLQLSPRDNAVDGAAAAAAAAGPAQTADLPLQQPAALPREAPAEGDLRGLGASSSPSCRRTRGGRRPPATATTGTASARSASARCGEGRW